MADHAFCKVADHAFCKCYSIGEINVGNLLRLGWTQSGCHSARSCCSSTVYNRLGWKSLQLGHHSLLNWSSLFSSHAWGCWIYPYSYVNARNPGFFCSMFISILHFCSVSMAHISYGTLDWCSLWLLPMLVSGSDWVGPELRSRFWLNHLLMTWTCSSRFIFHCPSWNTNHPSLLCPCLP